MMLISQINNTYFECYTTIFLREEFHQILLWYQQHLWVSLLCWASHLALLISITILMVKESINCFLIKKELIFSYAIEHKIFFSRLIHWDKRLSKYLSSKISDIKKIYQKLKGTALRVLLSHYLQACKQFTLLPYHNLNTVYIRRKEVDWTCLSLPLKVYFRIKILSFYQWSW